MNGGCFTFWDGLAPTPSVGAESLSLSNLEQLLTQRRWEDFRCILEPCPAQSWVIPGGRSQEVIGSEGQVWRQPWGSSYPDSLHKCEGGV